MLMGGGMCLQMVLLDVIGSIQGLVCVTGWCHYEDDGERKNESDVLIAGAHRKKEGSRTDVIYKTRTRESCS